MSFSTSAKVIVGLAGLLLFGLLAVLVAVLLSLEGTRSELRATRGDVNATQAQVQRLQESFRPLLATAAPLNDPKTRRTARRLARDVSSAAGLIPGLANDTTRGLDAATGIAYEIETAGLRQALTAGRLFAETATPAVQDLLPRATRFLAGLDVPAASLARCDRQLSTRAPAEAGQIACLLRTVPNVRALLKSVNGTLLLSLDTQRRTRDLTATTVDLFRESLAIQREILVRVRSLDTKFGGPAPSTSPVP